MEKYIALYQQIKAPKLDRNYVEHMIRFYIQEHPLTYHDFYASLLNETHHEQDHKNQKEEQRLYQEIFQKWRQSILNLTEEERKEPIDLIYRPDDLEFLYEQLKKISTYRELSNNPELSTYFYREILGIETSVWCHLESKKISVKPFFSSMVTHRIYLNCFNSDLHFMIRRLLELFEKKNLEYNLKFDTSEIARDDKVIIYTDTFHLLDYIQVLKEFEREYPEVMKRTLPPPHLVGRVDQWIGFGDEPEYENESYNDLRTRIFYDTITDQALKRIVEDREVLREIAYQFIEVKKLVPISYSLNAQDKIPIYQNVILQLKEEISVYLEKKEKKGTLLQELIQILPQYIEQYLETSSYYFDDVMEVLKEEFSKYHLDQEKTCFNQDTKEKFQLFNQKGIVSDQSFIRSLVIRNAPHYFKTDRGYYQSVQNILYLNFARFIGSDGTILCKNQTKEPARIFFERIAERYFSKKRIVYSDIFRKEMCGNTGKILLSSGEIVTPWEFTEFLGDQLLEKELLFQNSVLKTVRECMQELESYLPESGVVYTKYLRYMKLLDFFVESFTNQSDYSDYTDIVEWFYYQTGNHPGIFSFDDSKEVEYEILPTVHIESFVY